MAKSPPHCKIAFGPACIFEKVNVHFEKAYIADFQSLLQAILPPHSSPALLACSLAFDIHLTT